MRHWGLVASGLLLAVCGARASADPLGGIWNISPAQLARGLLYVVVIAGSLETGVVLIEGTAYRFVGGLEWKFALLASLVANGASLVLGWYLLALLTTFVGHSGPASFIGALVVTIALEVLAVLLVAKGKTEPVRLAWVVAGANIVTLSLFAFIVFVAL